MKAEELAVIKERAEKATEGPWEYRELSEWNIDVVSVAANEHGERKLVVDIHIGGELDAKFIANARGDVPKLVAEVERLRSVIWRISDYCDMSIDETIAYVNGEEESE